MIPGGIRRLFGRVGKPRASGDDPALEQEVVEQVQ